MASIEQVKAQLAAAIDKLDGAAGHAGTASNIVDDAKLMVMGTFEGSGNPEFLELVGQIDAVAVVMSEALVRVLQVQTSIQNVAARL